jgi:hypothetical protein
MHTGESSLDMTDSVSGHFTALSTSNRGLVSKAAENGILTVALFGGLGAAGSLEMVQVLIGIQSNPIQPIATSIQEITSCPLQNFCAIGDAAAVPEFVIGTSERSRTEFQNWKPAESGIAPRYYDVRRAIRLAELTIKYQARSDIGGPIDALQLNRDGTIEWYSRKQNCQEN